MAASQRHGVPMLLRIALAVLPLLCALFPAADCQLIDCYKFDGTLAPNNTRCPGSNACCGPDSTCLSTRLCTPDNNPNSNGRPVRGTCAVQGWDDSCPQICLYNEIKLFPRVATCSDGSLCCDDDPNCCDRGLGIFLDESGRRVASRATGAITRYPPTAGGHSRYTLMPSPAADSSTSRTTTTVAEQETTPTTSRDTRTSESATATAPTSAADSAETSPETSPASRTSRDADPTADAEPDPDHDSNPESASGAPLSASPPPAPSSPTDTNNSLVLQLGLGLGIPLAVLVLLGLPLSILYLRRLAARAAAAGGPPPSAPPSGSEYQPMTTSSAAATGPQTPASYPAAGVFSAHSHGTVERAESPETRSFGAVEMGSPHVVEIGGQMATELMTSPARGRQVQYYYYGS